MADDDKIKMGEERSLQIECDSGETKRDALARTFLQPEIQAAASLSTITSGTFSDTGFAELVDALKATTEATKKGEFGRIEETLAAQGVVLDAIFNHLAQRAISNMGHFVETVEIYMKLALRAQSQCRATLETLANIKNPKMSLNQTNIANNQQVNNLPGNQIMPSKLLGDEEHEPDKWLDRGTPEEAVRTDQVLEAVGDIDGTANG